jgi:putative spermidine/putrescine transport system permease protein
LAGAGAGVTAFHGARAAWVWTVPALLILCFLYLYPLINVLGISVVEPHPGLGNYAMLAASPGIRRVFWTTFRISTTATVLSVGLGYVVAYAMVHASSRHARLMLVCVLVPFWISVLVRAFAWVVLLRSEGVVNTALFDLGVIGQPLKLVYNETGVLVGTVHYMVPLAILTLYGQLSGIDQRLTMAARGLGAGPWFAFRRIFLPLSVPGIAAAAILVFIFGLGFYIIPALLGGGKTLMLAEYVSVLITETLNWGLGMAMASTLMVLALLLLLVASRVIDLRRVFGAA